MNRKRNDKTEKRKREVVKGCLSCRVVMTLRTVLCSRAGTTREARNPLQSYDKSGCDPTREISGLQVVNEDGYFDSDFKENFLSKSGFGKIGFTT